MLTSLLLSRTGLVAAGVGLAILSLFTWHTLDKSSAVRQAVIAYVAAEEMASLQAELAETKRLNIIFEAAAAELDKEVVTSQARAATLEKELKSYETDNPIDPIGRVTRKFLDGLH